METVVIGLLMATLHLFVHTGYATHRVCCGTQLQRIEFVKASFVLLLILHP